MVRGKQNASPLGVHIDNLFETKNLLTIIQRVQSVGQLYFRYKVKGEEKNGTC